MTVRTAAIDTVIQLPIIYGENLRAYRCHDSEVVLSGPADTGKTITLLTKLHWLMHAYGGAQGVIARKQLTDTYSTVLQTWQKEIIDSTVDIYGGEKAQWYDYPNGSRVWVAGMDKSTKVLSGQFDCIYVNQAEELSVMDWQMLTMRATGRAGHIPYPQTIGDCNPGPPSHWIRQRAKAGLLTLFSSRHQDNPDLYDQRTGEITEAGKRRIGALDRLTGALKKRYRYGLWAAPEGSIYGEHFDGLREDSEYGRHLVKAFEIPRQWPRAVGIDPAGAQRAALWLAYDPRENRLHVYREFVLPFGSTVQRFAEKVLEHSSGEPVFAWVCGAKSERDWRTEFQAVGIPAIEPPVADVWVGIDRVLDLLQTDSLVIHDCCSQLLSEIEEYHRKQNQRTGEFEDVIENKGKFHVLDCLRVVVVWLTHQDVQQTDVVYNPVKIGRY